MMRKVDFDEGWTRLPELEDRTDGAKLLPPPEYEAVPAGNMARSLKSDVVPAESESDDSTEASLILSSTISCILPLSLKTQDNNNDNMRIIAFITLTPANIEIFL